MDSLFGTWDYVVLVATLAISSGMGLYYRLTGGRQKTTQEYLLGDRDLNIVPVAISLMASFMSAITLLGVSKENYTFGIQFVAINFGYGLATPLAAYCFLPVFFRMQATSAYQYLEERFGRTARLLTSVAFSMQMVLYMGIVLYAPAISLEALTGISRALSITIIGLVCTFYSTIGGMKAVVLTDVFQSLLMFAAIFVVIIKAAVDVGGLAEIWRIAGEGGRLHFDNVSLDPTERHTWWSLMVGGGFIYLSLYAVNQTQVQRLLTLRDLRRSQIALWLSWPVLIFLSLSTSFSGLAIYSRYHHCDPFLQGRISSTDQLMPVFVGDTTVGLPGLRGLFVAGIFSASLSTISSAMNSLAAVTLEDYLKPLYMKWKGRGLPQKVDGPILKFLALAYGLLCVTMAFSAEYLGGILQASLTIFGVVGGPLLGIFTLGMFFTFTDQMGAVSGLLSGLAVAFWIGFGGPKPTPHALPTSTAGCPVHGGNMTDPLSASSPVPASSEGYFYLYKLSYMWYVLIGFVITLIVGLSVSIAHRLCQGKHEHHTPNPDLLVPCLRRRLQQRMAKPQTAEGELRHFISMDRPVNAGHHRDQEVNHL